jgi:hypothetical protein
MAELNRSKNPRNGMAPGSEAAAALVRGAEAWTSAQCDLLSGVEAIWVRSMQRRREAIDASARSLTQICESRNLADIVQNQQQWFADAFQRTASDLSALANDAAALTWQVAHVNRNGDATHPPAAMARRHGAEQEAPLHREAAE